MKIGFLNIYNGIVNRGAETFVKGLAARLNKKNKVSVFQAGEKEGGEPYEVFQIPINFDFRKEKRIDRFLSRFFLDYSSRLIFVFTLKAIPKIWKEKYDVVIPVNGGWMPSILRIVTWLYGGKLVITGQSGIGWDDRNNLWSFPDAFVALSSYALSWAKKANPFVKSVLIPNGVDLTIFKAKDSMSKKGKKTVLAVGAFTKEKRLNLAIDAVSKLKDVNLLIAGGGGDGKREIADYGVKILGENRFKVLSVPFEEMPEIYQKADVFTLPSKTSEAFGIVLVEAMASNLPVVATDDPIRREVVGKAGILVDPTDINSYSEALKFALEKDWGDIPRKQAEKFDWNKIAEKYEDLLEKLVL
jgi:glycosyltransferase involved in cell wall biosynthesis